MTQYRTNQAEEPKRRVKSVETTFSIIETLKDSDGRTLSELSTELDMAKSTVHRYLQTLLYGGYIVKEGSEYHLSLRFLELGDQASSRKRGYSIAREKVEELAEETDERAQFIVAEHGQAVYVHRKAGSHAVKTDPGIGKRIGLHTIAAGKAIIAEWPDEVIEEFVSTRELRSETPHTVTDLEDLMTEVEEIRERGYGVNKQENIEGLRAVGAAVCDQHGRPIGAFSVSGPTNRMKGEWFGQELPDLLLGLTNEMELNLRYS